MYYENFYEIIKKKMESGLCANIVYKGDSVSLKDFMSYVDEISKTLLKYNLATRVIIHMVGSIQGLATIFALWKLGKTYVPVNATISEKRLNLIRDTLGNYGEIDLTNDDNPIILQSGNKDFEENNNIAYIIFTSGTTGRPKGVEVSHDNIFSLLEGLKRKFNFSKVERWINLHSLEFDFSIWEMLAPLFYGHDLVMIGNTKPYELDKIANIILKHKITVLNQTPSAFFELLNYLPRLSDSNVRHVIFGGEKLSFVKLSSLREYFGIVNFYNLYGITETTVHATFHLVQLSDFDSPEISNIGKGIFDNNVLLDFSQDPSSDIGEIVVGGPTVANGYINNEEENHKRFRRKNGKFIYYSGDFGKYLENGEIEYIGRQDDQVEVNGYRVELGEVEESIKEISSDILDSRVVYHHGKLVAFYKGNKHYTNDEMRNKISAILPLYMCPSDFIQITKIPTTINGKTDTKRLIEKYLIVTAEQEKENSDSTIGKQSDFDDWLLEKVTQIVGKREIDINKSFLDLGLTSVQLISLHQELSEEFSGDKIPSIIDFFQFETIKDFKKNFNLIRKV